MPTFGSHVAVYFYKLFDDDPGAAGAFCSEAGGVVEMAIYVAVVFVVRDLWACCGPNRVEKSEQVKYSTWYFLSKEVQKSRKG